MVPHFLAIDKGKCKLKILALTLICQNLNGALT